MSAVVCGTKRSYFEELPPSPPIAKRHRCSSSSSSPIRFEEGTFAKDGEAAVRENLSAPSSVSLDGREWVDLFVNVMMSTASVEDARTRAGRALEALESSICARAGADAEQNFHKENMQLKEQIGVLLREYTILKRAAATQHERQKEFDNKNLELQQLKQLISQYQEQLRTLEINNYAFEPGSTKQLDSGTLPSGCVLARSVTI